MGKTDIGKYLAKLRIENDESMATMAQKIDVSTSFISAVETGKRHMPSTMINKIVDTYSLDDDEKSSFYKAISTSDCKAEITFKVGENAADSNAIALAFASTFSSLTDDQLEQIKKIIES